MVLRKLVILLLIGISFCAIPSKPYTLVTGNLVKANEWNANEDNLFAALTDGNGDLNVRGVSANYYTSSPATTYYKVVSPLEFIAQNNTTYNITNDSSSTYNSTSTTYNLYLQVANLGTVNATLRLPNNAIVSSIQTSTNTTNVYFAVYQSNVLTGVQTTICTFNSSAGLTTTPCVFTVVTATNNYYITAVNNSGIEANIWWAMVTYTRNRLGLVY